jgi:hypothetical protein
MDLASAFPEVQGSLESWEGYRPLTQVLNDFADLQVFVAGGAVRNSLLDPPIPVHDFDFFLDGPSFDRALTFLKQYGVLEQTPYGSPRWHPAHSPEQYADLIPIRDFRPGLWPCEDIVDVLNQFDYTASAIALDLRTGAGYDPQNGLRDLKRRTMRMVRFDYPDGPFIPGAALSRSAILWFRILHYASALRFSIEPLTLEWLRQHREFEKDLTAFATFFFEPNAAYLDPL